MGIISSFFRTTPSSPWALFASASYSCSNFSASDEFNSLARITLACSLLREEGESALGFDPEVNEGGNITEGIGVRDSARGEPTWDERRRESKRLLADDRSGRGVIGALSRVPPGRRKDELRLDESLPTSVNINFFS